jgi:primary-amine oxidase
MLSILPMLLAFQVGHPLEPLTEPEMRRAATIVRADARFTSSSRFATLGFKEPPKQEVLAWRPGAAFRREALALVFDWSANALSEVTVDLVGGRIAEWKRLPGKQPWVMSRDFAGVDSLVRADPRWQAAVRRRGVDPEKVTTFGFPADAYFPLPHDGHRYLATMTSWLPPRDGTLPGLVAFVDLTRGRVIDVKDTGGDADWHAAVETDSLRRIPATAPGPKPLEIRHPEGPTYRIEGHEVEWLNWRFRFAVESRSGLVLYQVTWRDGGVDRPVLYRAAPSEMVVPYGDPGWRIWMPLDIGYVGLGNYSKTSLVPGRDVPEAATFFESVMHDEEGNPIVVPRAAAVYERDREVRWRHGDVSRRARELVLAFYTTVDNYDYGFRWIFHEDGALELELELTGQVGTRAVAATTAAALPAEIARYGTLVAPHVVAPNHQHFFSFRLDLDVDGPSNRLHEINVIGEPAAPYRANGIIAQETLLRTELAARRELNLATSRFWTVTSSDHRNALGGPTGYALMPAKNATSLVPPSAFIRRAVGFVNYHLWATPERDDERYAAGTYAFIDGPGEGLPTWTRANRSLVDRDLVLWYTLGVTHIPRPEDWPVMPIVRTGFTLVPLGFFSENPALAMP